MTKFLKLQESRFILDTDASRGAIPIPSWGNYVTAGGKQGCFISEQDVKILGKFEGQTDDSIGKLLFTGNNGSLYGQALLHVLSSISDASVLKYTLELVEDALLPDVPGRAVKLFSIEQTATDLLTSEASSANDEVVLALDPFVKLLHNDDALVRSKSLYLASLLLSVSSQNPQQADQAKTILSATCDQIEKLKQGGNTCFMTGLQSLSVLLRSPYIREMFDQKGGLNILMRLIDQSFHTLGAETQYHAVLSLWLACFSSSGAEKLDQASLATLVAVIRSDPLLRVTRLCLSTIRLVLTGERQKILCESLIEDKLPKFLAQIAAKKGIKEKDKELAEDLDWLQDTLKRNFTVLTTFERHEQELLSRKLVPGMVHEELFWRENALQFEKNNFSSIKLLIDLLRKEEDPLTVATAASDIGYFVQYFPNGKFIVDGFGGKVAIMKLLSDPNPEVQKQALTACSKIMVTNWEDFRSS
mmetsp:Transcript_8323/g.15513  ORF Transcript_8323/g.15513 Transcript_8323/m.15513 type:complete len:473 (+) Transcript_8323:409-1827(+)|eukprot:CAMPEP_0203751962 /NCGR_PEP_ID=MMETSP0098-20131031/5947_1 /ASSEMBLY_ACC=CAM_ASM_000208 /TAXON_ID=96639 /ORGANISM=" , Strain NY0313808BC1" /LENGTH=472 /DNA_ID=CAMNT_0050641929 /DNA_START=336 /DNA_END=1754 /DNA_ORIENTATION=-